MSRPPPSAAEQIRFLQRLQRLLDEGSFVATYKYALLHAIADLCVQRGEDTGEELELSVPEIAERFVELYWRQAVPFPSAAAARVLRQNSGRQAAIVRHVREARARYGDSLPGARRQEQRWRALRREVDGIVRKMPLWKLQTVGRKQADFLYENVGRGSTITLRSGVMYCFRAFYALIADLIEGAWAQYVRELNPRLLGAPADLRSFLFGADRASLARFRDVFEGLQDGRCFYCDAPLRRDVAVDHFIPWVRYPLDLGHNFVLADPRCNSRKGDLLAAEDHLERWTDRNRTHGEALAERFTEIGAPHDLETSFRVARWAYGNVHRAEGQVWVLKGELRTLSDGWERVLEE